MRYLAIQAIMCQNTKILSPERRCLKEMRQRTDEGNVEDFMSTMFRFHLNWTKQMRG